MNRGEYNLLEESLCYRVIVPDYQVKDANSIRNKKAFMFSMKAILHTNGGCGA